MKLNLGCGPSIIKGFVNIDLVKHDGVDLVFDLDSGERLPFDDNTVDYIVMSHILEHIRNPLPLMEELHRVAMNDCICEIRLPHGANDDAWEDPTHVKAYFPNSFSYFSQPYYFRLDYGYMGDWCTDRVSLLVNLDHKPDNEEAHEIIYSSRNKIKEMAAFLRAVKPVRERKNELIKRVPIMLDVQEI